MEAVIGIAGLILSAVLYVLGRRDGVRQERARQQQEERLEADRVLRERMNKLVDEYVAMARTNYASGLHALQRLGLHLLGSDAAIRQALDEMRIRSGKNPLGKQEPNLGGVDLLLFFQYVADKEVNFVNTSVESVLAAMEEERQQRSQPALPSPTTP